MRRVVKWAIACGVVCAMSQVAVAELGRDWAAATTAAPWSARSMHGFVAHGGHLWVLGGKVSPSSWACVSDVWRSADGVNWTRMTSNAPWPDRWTHTVLSYSGRIWIFGGRDSGGNALYDSYSSADGSIWSHETSSLPVVVDQAAMTVFDGKMWIVDWGSSYSSTNGIDWQEIDTNLGIGTAYAGLTEHNGKMWIVGGFGGGRSVWSSPDGVDWTEVTSAAPWEPLRGHGCVSLQGRLWIVGGTGHDQSGTDVRDQVWSSADGISWTLHADDPPWSNRELDAAVFNNSIVFSGGQVGYTTLARDVWYSQSAVPTHVQVSGWTGVGDVTVEFTGLSSVVSNEQGLYIRSDVPYGWSGSIRPVKAGYTFSPETIDLTNLQGDVSDQNFSAHAIQLTISGWTAPETEVAFTGLSSATADATGLYMKTDIPWGWSGTATPSKAGVQFEPPQRSYTNLTENLADQNFIAQTPTPVPTPPSSLIYTFDSDRQGWVSVAVGSPLTDPVFDHAEGALRITATDNSNNYGWWNSPDGDAPIVADSLYRSVWTVKSNVSDPSLVPSLRLRVNAMDFQQANYLRVDSSGDGSYSPNQSGKRYPLYFVSPVGANGDMWAFAFELINFSGLDAADGYLALDSLVVDRLPIPGAGTHVRTYTFDQNEEGWAFSGDIDGVTAPTPIYPGSIDEIGLVATGNVDCFGFWTSFYSDLPLGADETLYRLTFDIRTDTDDPTAVPGLRVRAQTDNFQSASVLRVESFDDCANGPGTTGRDYALYYVAPSSADGAYLLASFDLVGMNPNDSATAGLHLDGVVVETLDHDPIVDPTPVPTGTSLPTPTPTPPETPTPGSDLTLSLPGGVTLDMVWISAGAFEMGRYPGERDSNSNEDPQHTVTIDYGFRMGVTEVTQAQWEAVMGSNPGYGGGDYPVFNVSWDDIVGSGGFLETLNAHLDATGQGVTVRLPSEAEWEYCCRAGTTTRFYFGNSLGCAGGCEDCAAEALPGSKRSDYMWYCGSNSPSSAKPVAGKFPSAWGLHDMSGNVYEWCQDDWHSSYTGAPDDGSPWGDGSVLGRVIRGGSWYNTASDCRSAFRFGSSPVLRNHYLGFRAAAGP